MYFSNIMNEELTKFHNQNIENFSISLSDLLESELFNVETIMTDSLYRVYPLFYCETVSSTNSNDKILSNRCFILNKESSETYITFTSDDDADIRDYRGHEGYFGIGESLTDSEFNAVVQLLRNNDFAENISVQQGKVTGTYGDYTFDINSTTIIDTGVLITYGPLQNLGTVKLTDPIFPNSTYTLKLKVYHINNVNVIPDDSEDNIEVTTVSIVLVPNQEIIIPFSQFNAGNYVVAFDATVEVVHDKPIITGSWVNELTLSGDKSIIQVGETVNLIATAKDINDIGVAGKPIYFYEEYTPALRLTADKAVIQSGETTVLSAQLVDAEDGNVVKESGHRVNFVLLGEGIDLNCTHTVVGSDGFANEKSTIVAQIFDENGQSVSGRQITIKKDGTAIHTDTSDDDGVVSVEYESSGDGTHTFVAEGDGFTSNTIQIKDLGENTVDKTVSVVWSGDNNNRDNNRPETIRGTLFMGQTDFENIILSEENNWSYTFEDLMKYSVNGTLLNYTFAVTSEDDFYSSSVGDETNNTFPVTMTYDVDTVERSIIISWDDSSDSRGLRPSSVGAVLNSQSITVSANVGWTVTLSDLPEYKNRELVTYEWTTDSVENYMISRKTTSGTTTTVEYKYFSGASPVLE